MSQTPAQTVAACILTSPEDSTRAACAVYGEEQPLRLQVPVTQRTTSRRVALLHHHPRLTRIHAPVHIAQDLPRVGSATHPLTCLKRRSTEDPAT